MTDRFRSVAIFFLLPVLFYLSYALDHDPGFSKRRSGDLLYQLIGGAQEVVGDTFFLKADSYFHGGAEHTFSAEEEHFHKEGEEDHDEDSHQEAKTVLASDWIAAVNHQVHITKHRHLTESEIKEMLPFLNLSVQLDPYNVEAILATAYWLERHLHKTEEALGVLKQGLKNNPTSWEINYHIGSIYFKTKGSVAESTPYFEEALRQIKDPEAPEAAEPTYFLAEAYAAQNRQAEALLVYQKALTLFKDKNSAVIQQTIRDKIKQISQESQGDLASPDPQ